VVEVETMRPLFLDTYAAQRRTGSFILIDPASHATVAAGMVREDLSGRQRSASTVAAIAILILSCSPARNRIEKQPEQKWCARGQGIETAAAVVPNRSRRPHRGRSGAAKSRSLMGPPYPSSP
jgi:hypothetical protein